MRKREQIGDREYFIGNKVVAFMFEMNDNIDFNKLWSLVNRRVLSKEDLEEFYQLIGYSIDGYEELFNK